MPPSAVGPFQILRELGRGGMGEVYLARDTRLDRNVAIKALPAHLASDPERLARFQREAKVLASLSHPGIGAIYGLEEASGHQYLVLEFIEGGTLADRLGGGAIPVDEALTIAGQIAEAVEIAHEKGVIHRDLKPGNVMVTPEGVVKVLDFGLARTADGSVSTSRALAPHDSPTLTTPPPVHSPTMPGVIMGTAGYMSPEQARGKSVDKRSDIFSFGCVLFEMLTGIGPFPGETVTDSIGAVLHREPDWALLPLSTPPRIRELLRVCLAKDRRHRLRDIGDARLEIERAVAGHEWTAVAASPPIAVKDSRRRSYAIVAVGLIVAALLGANLLKRPPVAAPQQAYHVSTALPAKPRLNALAAISPDSRFVACLVWPELPAESLAPTGQIMLRRLDRDETTLIAGTEGARAAALSPDGRWLAFAAAKSRGDTRCNIKKIELADGKPIGAPTSLCELPRVPADLCWISDHDIVVASSWESTVLAISADGGDPRVVVRGESGKGIDDWGALRPLNDGRSILATRWTLAGQSIKAQVELVDVVSGQRAELLANAGAAVYVPGATSAGGGCLVATRGDNTLIAVPFDAGARKVTGAPVTVWSGGYVAGFALSKSGTLALVVGTSDNSGRRLARIDDRGQVQPVPGSPRAFLNVAVSPDGGRVLSTLGAPGSAELPSELWVLDLARRTLNRMPAGGFAIDCGVWSRDGRRIAYSVIGDTETSIWERRADGTGEPVKLYAEPSKQLFLTVKDYSPDDRVLAIARIDLAKSDIDILMLERPAGGAAWAMTPYLASAATEDPLSFSPDGKWVRFVSEESGRSELYVQRYTGAGAGADDAKAGRVQISTAGCSWSSWWSPDLREIRYVDADKQVMSVKVTTEPSFSASLPQVLYSIKELNVAHVSFAPDGNLMVVLSGEGEEVTKIDLVVNFLDELRAKLASAR